jgi:hypothetical protein
VNAQADICIIALGFTHLYVQRGRKVLRCSTGNSRLLNSGNAFYNSCPNVLHFRLLSVLSLYGLFDDGVSNSKHTMSNIAMANKNENELDRLQKVVVLI